MAWTATSVDFVKQNWSISSRKLKIYLQHLFILIFNFSLHFFQYYDIFIVPQITFFVLVFLDKLIVAK